MATAPKKPSAPKSDKKEKQSKVLTPAELKKQKLEAKAALDDGTWSDKFANGGKGVVESDEEESEEEEDEEETA